MPLSQPQAIFTPSFLVHFIPGPDPTHTGLTELFQPPEGTFGLGENVPPAMTNGGEAITALVDGKFLTFHVPYPAGFFTKNVAGRIDDPGAGWKSRGLWTTSGARAMFHNETGKGESPRVYRVQLRPDPLAH